jgi:hypothetical protein
MTTPEEMRIVMSAYRLVHWTLLLAPPFAVATFFSIRSYLAQAHGPLLKLCLAVLLASIIAVVFGLHFIATTATLVSAAVAYFCLCYIATSAFNIKIVALRIVALIAGAILPGLGYTISTIGMFVLLIFINEYVRLPEYTVHLNEHLTCEKRGWGMSFTASGYDIVLYKRFAFMPYVERTVSRVRVVEGQDNALPSRATCEEALATYSALSAP